MGRTTARLPSPQRAARPANLPPASSMLKRVEKPRASSSEPAREPEVPGKGIITFHLDGRKVYSKPGKNIKQALDNAKDAFPELKDIDSEHIRFYVDTSGNVAPNVWLEFMSQQAPYAIIYIHVSPPPPQIILHDCDGHDTPPQYAEVDAKEPVEKKDPVSIPFPSTETSPSTPPAYVSPPSSSSPTASKPRTSLPSSPPRSRTNSESDDSDSPSGSHTRSSFKSKAKSVFGLN